MGPARFAVVAIVVVAVLAVVAAVLVPGRGDGAASVPVPAPCVPSNVGALQAGAPRWRDGTAGAAAGISFPGDALVESDADLARELDGVAASGARWVRVDVDWSFVEEAQGTFDWCRPDRFIVAARQRGLDVVAILAYSPRWETGSQNRKTAPRDPADYAAFVTAAVARYAPGGVHAWEVWNEPNIAAFWAPKPDPGAYARLLRAAAPAIRAADPDATVISAGLAPAPDSADGRFVDPETFLTALLAAGAIDVVDAVGYHPYSFPDHPTRAGNAFSRLPDIHALLDAQGHPETKLWLTEVGAPTGGGDGAVPEEEQAVILREAYEAVAAWAWVGPMLWYTYRDLGTDQADIGQSFGLVRNDFEAKPALRAFTDAMAAAR